MTCFAQERREQNRPYCDLRPFHFGVVVGAHVQDLEFTNAAPSPFVGSGGITTEPNITCEQDTWDMGFQVGVLGELRLNSNFAFRVAPTMYFASRNIKFHDLDATIRENMYKNQTLKSVYLGCNLDLIFAAPRFNNHRPYLMAGLAPMLNLSTKGDDYLQLKKSEVFFEAGVGCDLYLPFFKLRPELKFMYGLSNALNTDHVNHLREQEMIPFTRCVSKARSKIIALTFYFE